MIRLIVISMAITIGAGVTAIAYGLQAGATPSGALGPGEITVDIDITRSAFSVGQFVVHPGTSVRFVVHNHDPIRHELIVGPPDVQARHEGGHEAQHPPVPGEMTIDPEQTAETTYRFDQVGAIEFACHLPGHYQYGMHGWVRIV